MSTSQDPRSTFMNLLVCTNVEYNGDLQAIARNILVNLHLKRRENGETKTIATFHTEDSRIEVLEKEFGIKLTTQERNGMKGRKVAVENFDPHTKQFEF